MNEKHIVYYTLQMNGLKKKFFSFMYCRIIIRLIQSRSDSDACLHESSINTFLNWRYQFRLNYCTIKKSVLGKMEVKILRGKISDKNQNIAHSYTCTHKHTLTCPNPYCIYIHTYILYIYTCICCE